MTIAASWSLSPSFISSTLMVSFSLMIGTASHSNRACKGVSHVQVARAAVEIFMRQKELRRVAAMPAQPFVVGADQVRLADGRRRLKLAKVLGPALPAELAHSRPDRPRAHERHFPALVHHQADLLGEVVDSSRVKRAVRAGQNARTDFHDPRLRRQHDFVSAPGRGRARTPVCARRRPAWPDSGAVAPRGDLLVVVAIHS